MEFNQNLLYNFSMAFACFKLILNDKNEAEDYIFLDVNNDFEKLISFRRDEIIGKKASEVFGGANFLKFDWVSYYGRVLRSGRVQETIQWFEGIERYFKITAVPSEGYVLSIIIQAVPEYSPFMLQKNGNDHVIMGLDAIFNKTHDAILIVEYSGGEFRFFMNNESHQRLTGFSDIKNTKPVEMLGEEIGGKLLRYYEQCISTGRPVSYEQNYDFSPGKRIWHTKITPVLGLDDKSYLICSSEDITELKAAQSENELLVKRLKSMFYNHSAIMLVIELVSGRIVDANPAACRFYGYSKEEIQKLHITDINILPQEEVEKKRMEAHEGKQRYFVFPHRLKNGSIRMVDVYSCSISEGENKLLYSIIFDVTDRENYKDELYREKEMLKTTLQSIGDGVVTTDGRGVITSLNAVAQELTGWSDNEARDRRFSDIFVLQNEDTGYTVENPIQKVLDTGRIMGLANHTIMVNRQHRSIPIADSAAPIKSEDGRTLGVVMVFRDVSNEKEHNKQISYLSYHDSLTGLYNRSYIEEKMESLDIEENLPIAVIMGDVNGLKITNDVFGHETGDQLLKHMAESLKRNCRENDVIARWGGDEVVIFMPRTSLSTAEEIIHKFKNSYIDVEKSGLHMSISFGCAVKKRAQESIHVVMRKAEEYMYHQKLLDGKSYRNAIINTLLATLYEKSNETEEHSKRIEKYCHSIGRKLKLSSKEMNELSLLAILHDIGKVSINTNILKKPVSLTSSEWREMRHHPEIGYRIAHATPELAIVADFILSHHERWDGSGYPRGLKGKDIPLVCRILAVTDAFDAMTNDRIYRKAMSREEAITELKRNSGVQFDPEITDLFIEILMLEDGHSNEC